MNFERLTGQLPGWARTEHPVLRYELSKTRTVSRRTRYFRALWIVLAGLALLAIGYLIATGFLRESPGIRPWEQALNILFWPLLSVQFLMSIIALGLTGNTVSEEVQRQTWDNLRATDGGAELAIRTRWIAVFYRLRGLITILLLVRAGLILGILADLNTFNGRFLDLLIEETIPGIPFPVAALMLAFTMTASLLLPLTALGFDAALGLLIATRFHQRIYAILAQVLYAVLRLVILAGLAYGAAQFVNNSIEPTSLGAWVLMGGFASVGDWGLSFLNLGLYGELWITIPYGVFLGPALLLFALLQAGLIDWIISRAIRQAQMRG